MSYMEVRTALQTSTNNDWSGGTTLGGAEIQKRVEEMAVEAYNKVVDLSPLLRRVNISQLAFIWNVVKETAANSGMSNSSFSFYSEAANGTPAASAKAELYAVAKSYRTDYEVSGLMLAAGMGNQLLEEARYAIESHAVGEERSIICGTDTSAYGFSGAFAGLLQLMSSYAALGDTTAIYGVTRASGVTYMDAQVVLAGATSADALDLPDLDAAITASNKTGGKNARRIFFCSEDRMDEISQLLQAQQRFNSSGNTIEFDGGFRVLAYKRVPIVGSRFMDKNGVTYNGSSLTLSHADQAMYLLDLDQIQMVHVAGVNATHVPIMGADAQQRADVQGGYYKSYGVLVMKKFVTQVIIANLTDI